MTSLHDDCTCKVRPETAAYESLLKNMDTCVSLQLGCSDGRVATVAAVPYEII